MATLDELKRLIDLHDLADKLGLERPGGGGGNYRSPRHADKSPSLSIFEAKDGSGQAWKDWSTDEGGGNPPSLVAYVENLDFGAAVRRVHELYGIPNERRQSEQKARTPIEGIAAQCLRSLDGALEYLTGRGIPEAIVRRAHQRGALGFSDWHKPGATEGQVGYQGPAACFVVRTMNPGHVVAVDKRFLDPDTNGGTKTWTLGEKSGVGWTSDLRRLEKAHTVYICESGINALSVEAANIPYSAAYATRGTANASNIDWRFLVGKRVVVCMDADEPDDKGRRPGPEAAWAIHEACTALNIPCELVDQADWYENSVNDLNDLLQAEGDRAVRAALFKREQWAIAGLPSEKQREELPLGRARIYLPPHDENAYWRFRCKRDFTTWIDKVDEGEDGASKPRFKDVAGFRIAAMSRVRIASATATMTGDEDAAPRTVFAVSVDVPRHGDVSEESGARLYRRVLDDEKLYNIDQWRKFGPVFLPQQFNRLLTLWERAWSIGARDAANFVGLCWRGGKPVVNEGPDCYFTDPEKQCPYANLQFPSGSRTDARRVIDAYQSTFRYNAAAQTLVWGLGGHLKAYLGFWPHLEMQAAKGAGKSTLLKHLERTLVMEVKSGQSINTDFRLLTSVSHTSHPVGWEELSARRQDIIDKAVSMLQEAYNYTSTQRGSEMTQFLISAPVLLSGEDVPVPGLIGKLVRVDLTDRKGDMLPEDLPKFPIKDWLNFLAGLGRARARATLAESEKILHELSAASRKDEGGKRMERNYAAVLTSWRLLCEWLEIEEAQGDFLDHLAHEMNAHITQTRCDREPWVHLLDKVFSRMAEGEFRHPYGFDTVKGEPCLLIRLTHVMDHIAHSPALRDVFHSSSIKSQAAFRQRIEEAGLIHEDGLDRRLGQRRVARLQALSLEKLRQWGLDPPYQEDLEMQPEQKRWAS